MDWRSGMQVMIAADGHAESFAELMVTVLPQKNCSSYKNFGVDAGGTADGEALLFLLYDELPLL